MKNINVTKEQFEKVINDIIAAIKYSDDLVSHGIQLEEMENIIEQFEKFIGEIFGVSEIIGDFIYWLAIGTEFFIPSINVKSETVQIKTIDDLWNFITQYDNLELIDGDKENEN